MMTINRTGLENLSEATTHELSQAPKATKYLVVIRLIGDSVDIWEDINDRTKTIDNGGEYDGYLFDDGSVLGSDGNGYQVWPTLDDWKEEFGVA